ncbi:hypothetical protein [Neisseria maigaei]|uniref:hypothetical protein n=1 Tax=Neisseria maigaei TaxID=2830651 RepID=UPI002658C678|nr:hypothetical protein [Neisseria maigaei]
MPSETLNAPKKIGQNRRPIKRWIFTGRYKPAFGQSVIENNEMKNMKFIGNAEILDCKDLSAPPSFPRKWESSSFGFACFKFRVTSTSSFPRRRESSFLSFSHSR